MKKSMIAIVGAALFLVGTGTAMAAPAGSGLPTAPASVTAGHDEQGQVGQSVAQEGQSGTDEADGPNHQEGPNEAATANDSDEGAQDQGGQDQQGTTGDGQHD
jgi:hypothetical protein